MSEPLVDIEDLAIAFRTPDGEERVIDGAELRIHPGEVVGLVGETGCGKSVTAKLLLGILPMPPARITRGHVRLFGRDLATVGARERGLMKRHVAYVPQDPSGCLNPSFTVGTQMVDQIIWQASKGSLSAYFRSRHRRGSRRDAEERAAALLEKVYISDPSEVLRRYPTQLSGGMRQRVLIALALSGSPKLMIADEPTTALDVTVQMRTIELLRELIEREGMSGLFITHDLGVARAICARTYVMYAGAMVESAPTPELLEAPLHPYTRGLVAAVPGLERRLPQPIPGSVPDYLAPPQGCRFAPRCGQAMARCRAAPSLAPHAPSRAVACWLHEAAETA